MNRLCIFLTLSLGLSLGLGLGFGLGAAGDHAHITATAAAAERTILYYRDPSGSPFWSSEPRKDQHGRDFLPVYDDEEPSFDPPRSEEKQTRADDPRKVLYYRNPMGLPDTSPVPKKDSMGMDYIPVYADDEPGDGATIKVSLDRVQRSGVRTERIEPRVLVHPVRAVGSVAIDESKLTIVTLRSDGYIEDLFVNTTGQPVRAGEPLFRVYSADIQKAQIDLMVAVRTLQRGVAGVDAEQSLSGAMQKLRNLGVPESRINDVRRTGANPRTIDWPSPASGVVINKKIINGQRVSAGDELYRIADLSTVWVIADVAEADLAEIKSGTLASVTFRAYPTEPVEGRVTLIYPEVKSETRTVRVRIELPNPEGRLKADMYADVVFRVGMDDAPAIAIPDSAVIDSGTQRIAFIAKGGGRFEPRNLKLGRRGDGYREVLDGVREGEDVVTTATFLIDAESNLRAALRTFSDTPAHQEAAR